MINKKNMNIENYQVVKKAQAGDMQAFNEIVKIYDRNILGIITNFRFGSDDAKDIYVEISH